MSGWKEFKKDWKNFKNNRSTTSENTVKAKSVLILDMMYLFKSHFVANRAVSERGVPVGAVKGCLDQIYFGTKKFRAKQIICVFDGSDSHAKRQDIFEDYKSHRGESNANLSSPHNLSSDVNKTNKDYQMKLLVEILKFLPVKIIIHKKLEADDIIGYLTKTYFADRGGRRIIISADKDFLQLIDANTSVYNPRRKELYNTKNVKKYWDTYPKNIIYYRCIEGDASDNVDGIHGVGTKTIEKYFPELKEQEFESLEDFVDLIKSKEEELQKTKTSKKIINGIDKIRRNYKLCQLQDVELLAGEKQKVLSSMDLEEYDYMSKYKLQEFVKKQQVDKILSIYRLQDLYDKIRI